MSSSHDIVNNSHVGPYVLGMHFHKLLKEFPTLKNETTTTPYLRYLTEDSVSLYVDKETNNLIGIKIFEKDSANYLGVSVGSSRSQVKKLQSPPHAPGIQIEYHENRVSVITIFLDIENEDNPDLEEIIEFTPNTTLSLLDVIDLAKKNLTLLVSIGTICCLLFLSFQQSKFKLAKSPSYTLKQVVATTKDNHRLSFTLNIHPKISSDKVRNFHEMIRSELQEQVVIYIMTHSKKELYLFNNGNSLAVNLSNFLNYTVNLKDTENELTVKNIRIKG